MCITSRICTYICIVLSSDRNMKHIHRCWHGFLGDSVAKIGKVTGRRTKQEREEKKTTNQHDIIIWKHLCKIIGLCGSIYKEIKSSKIKAKNTLLEKICDPLTTWVTWFVLTCFYSTTLYISVGKLVEDRLETG